MTDLWCDEERGLIEIPVESLLDYWHPIEQDVWSCGTITREEVLAHANDQNRTSTSTTIDSEHFTSHDFNVERISYIEAGITLTSISTQ